MTAIGRTPLVSREAEMALLREAIDDAARGAGNAVYIGGPPGIGKSRLASEALRVAQQMEFRVAFVAGWSDGATPPLWPWQAVLHQLGRDGSVLHGADQERFAAFRAVADAVVEIARAQPLLIVVDDAHAADIGALLLARFVIRSIRAARVLVIVTARELPDMDPSTYAALRDFAQEAVILRPEPLGVDGIETLLRATGRAISDAEVGDILELTGGNPMFIAELLSAGPSTGQISVDSVRSILRLRLGSLPSGAEEMLTAVAILGPVATVRRVADVAAVDAVTGRDLLLSAQRVGVLTIAADDTCRFTHWMLAEALVAEMTRPRLAALHEAVIRSLSDTGTAPPVHGVLALAHHCVEAASIRGDHTSIGIAAAACRRAAAALVAGVAYEAAAQILRRAVDLYELAGLAVPTDLLVGIARSELSAGDLRQARISFRRAADRATEAVDLAEAAVGLGGIWVFEHRTTVEHASFVALLDDAERRLGDQRPDLTIRLRVRRAAELVYSRRGSIQDVLDAVAMARDLDVPLVLAESLSLLHHTMLGPANTTPQRLAIADELVLVSARAGDEVLALMGVLWRAIDLVLMGDRLAERAIAEARERADALQVAAVLFVLDAMDVMMTLRAGEISNAESMAHRCFERGLAIGDADATGYLGAHLLTIRWLQMRPAEILPMARQVAESSTLVQGDLAPLAAAAVFAAMVGEFDRAQADLQHVIAGIAVGTEVSSNWMITMFCAAEAAALLDDQKSAESIYSALTPFRHLPIMGSLGIVCLGSTERTLGVAARTFGDLGRAAHHFAEGVDHDHRLGNRVMAAITEGDLGCVLLERGAAGDIARGRFHLDRAMADLTDFGLGDRVQGLVERADRLIESIPIGDGRIRRAGSMWQFTVDGHSVEVTDSVGVQRLIRLLEHPQTDIAATDLTGDDERSVRQPISDTPALRAYRQRIDELRSLIGEADEEHDIERASMLRSELDSLLDSLGPTLGIRGRTRSFGDSSERARVAVRKSLGRVFEAIAEQDLEFATMIRDSIHTGSICRFEPVATMPSVWRRGGDG